MESGREGFHQDSRIRDLSGASEGMLSTRILEWVNLSGSFEGTPYTRNLDLGSLVELGRKDHPPGFRVKKSWWNPAGRTIHQDLE